ncbi:hypothetical protein SLEP1_g49729 [Rubroshorea leprosula]|uniref:Uncharacterized protein n=1 Tax=Rubroshorea leprosula TaxID=152421 RepID=A0AAV5LXS1_9ROSI|nr:hypothetical protein SLEP1_g49729 [Rubroshorea leprosula]
MTGACEREVANSMTQGPTPPHMLSKLLSVEFLRNEFRLGQPELYKQADRDDPKALKNVEFGN